MSALDWLVGPFADFGFMRRALAGAVSVSLGAAPLGVFLVLRRMSLMGDAMSHAILPGVAAGFLLSGMSLGAMLLGGIFTGLAVALLSGLVARLTPLREDASFATFYLMSLSLGVLLVSLRGSNMDLLHVLFGTVLGLDDPALLLMTSAASVTLLALAVLFRALVAECLDAGFLRVNGGPGTLAHMALLVLVVLNLVAGFQALGTLMVVGMMMLPAAAARFWRASVIGQILAAMLLGVLASVVGLLVSYHADVPGSPSIILSAGAMHVFSVLFGPHGGLLTWSRRARMSVGVVS